MLARTVCSHRLLTEDGCPSLGGGPYEAGVGVSGGGDDDALGSVFQHVTDVWGPWHAHLGRHLLGLRRVAVDDNELVHLGQRVRRLGVQGPDATDPDYPDPHGPTSIVNPPLRCLVLSVGRGRHLGVRRPSHVQFGASAASSRAASAMAGMSLMASSSWLSAFSSAPPAIISVRCSTVVSAFR